MRPGPEAKQSNTEQRLLHRDCDRPLRGRARARASAVAMPGRRCHVEGRSAYYAKRPDLHIGARRTRPFLHCFHGLHCLARINGRGSVGWRIAVAIASKHRATRHLAVVGLGRLGDMAVAIASTHLAAVAVVAALASYAIAVVAICKATQREQITASNASTSRCCSYVQSNAKQCTA